MDIIQEIKKCQEKIDANTERIFKLQRGGSNYVPYLCCWC